MLNKKESNMKQLNKQQQAVVDKLINVVANPSIVKKRTGRYARGSNKIVYTRLPQIKTLVSLLDSLGVSYKSDSYDYDLRTKCAGLRYSTGGGTRDYIANRLKVDAIDLDIDTQYKWAGNNSRIASRILGLVIFLGYDITLPNPDDSDDLDNFFWVHRTVDNLKQKKSA
jgi:hypothetical protein